MPLPENLRTKFLARFDELIQEGQAIYDSITVKVEQGEIHYPKEALRLFGAEPWREASQSYEEIDLNAFKKWQINYASLLDQVIPRNSIHRKLIENLEFSSISKYDLTNRIAILRAIREDFEQGFLENIIIQIEAAIAADYMGQAEQLLSEGQSGKFDHVPAAVLSGAVLEKALRTLCKEQTPPIPTTKIVKGKEQSLTLNPLIDELKKSGVFNELKAKQLRAWADIQNAAAHGDFSEFTRSDVEQMIRGINEFLAR